MVRGRARIESLEAGRTAIADGLVGDGDALVVPVARAVPDWLGHLVGEAGQLDVDVLVEAEPPADLEGEALDGWEIGVCTAAFAAGAADVLGVDPQRVNRVRTVGSLLADHAPQPDGEVTP